MKKKIIIILHGWTKKHHLWKKIIKALKSKGYLVYYPVLPGFSDQKLTKVWKLSDYVLWLKKYLEKKHISRCSILAHSNGGRIAVGFADKYSQKLEKLVLIESAGILPKPTFKKTFFWMMAKAGKIVFLLPGLNFFRTTARKIIYFLAREQDYYQADSNLAKTMINLISLDLGSLFTKIKIPSLVIWGGLDKSVPLSAGLQIKKFLGNSKFILFPKQNHALPYNCSDTLASEIDKFLK